MKMSQTRACCNHGWGRWRLTTSGRGAHDLKLTMLDLAARAKPCKALRVMCEGCIKRHIRLFTQCAARSTRSCRMQTTDYHGLGIDAVGNASGHHAHKQRDTRPREAPQDTMFSDSPWRCTTRKALALPGGSNRSISMYHGWNKASMALLHSRSTFRRPDSSAPRS